MDKYLKPFAPVRDLAQRCFAYSIRAHLLPWSLSPPRKLCCAVISLSEEDLLRVRQESQGCFTQLDRSLALPRVRARVLQQQLQMARREAEFRKLDQALAAPELQVRAMLGMPITEMIGDPWGPVPLLALNSSSLPDPHSLL